MYLRHSSESVFSMVKPSESGKTLSCLGEDLFFLARRFREEKAVSEMTSYRLLCRCLAEQCVVEDAGTVGEKVRVKPNADVASDSLQNPSDPDATYSGHKGQGYQAQIMETCFSSPAAPPEGETPAGASDAAGPRLITHVAVRQAHESDANALIPAIEDARERGLSPTEVLADSLYGSEKNIEKAAAMRTEVVAPVPGGQTKSKSSYLSEFALTDEGGIANCPMGHAPIDDAPRRNHREVIFSVEHCLGCPKRKNCPVKPVRRGYGFSYDKKQVKMARRRARERTAAFRNRYRFRSGIEATISELDRRTGVKRLRVRGMEAVRYCVTLKVLGLNIFRAAAFRVRNERKNPVPAGILPRPSGAMGAPFRHLVILSGFKAGLLRHWRNTLVTYNSIRSEFGEYYLRELNLKETLPLYSFLFPYLRFPIYVNNNGLTRAYDYYRFFGITRMYPNFVNNIKERLIA